MLENDLISICGLWLVVLSTANLALSHFIASLWRFINLFTYLLIACYHMAKPRQLFLAPGKKKSLHAS